MQESHKIYKLLKENPLMALIVAFVLTLTGVGPIIIWAISATVISNFFPYFDITGDALFDFLLYSAIKTALFFGSGIIIVNALREFYKWLLREYQPEFKSLISSKQALNPSAEEYALSELRRFRAEGIISDQNFHAQYEQISGTPLENLSEAPKDKNCSPNLRHDQTQERIEKLKMLHISGAISDEEYEAQRKRILNEI
jgi:hypothetical protein